MIDKFEILGNDLRKNNCSSTILNFQEIQPTLDELGIANLAEMGYDKPELALPNPYEVHG